MNLLFIPFIPYININHLDCLTSYFDLRRGLVCKSSSTALLYAMMCTASLYVGGSQIFYHEFVSGGPRNSLHFGIPEVSWFGHYIREWKDFPVLLEA